MLCQEDDFFLEAFFQVPIMFFNVNFFQWNIFLDPEGRIMDPVALKKRIFYGGVQNGLRKEVCMLWHNNRYY